jgi:hypothetical protein
MAAKRKTKTSKPKETMGPSKWRLQHGGFSEPIRAADPDTGTPVQHRRAVDTLGMMLANGTITPQMHEAAAMFRATFRVAALDGMRTAQLLRVRGGGGDLLSERQAAARRRLAADLDLFGGADSPGGSCLWHVLGLEYSLREWAMRQGWSGRPVHHVQAQGILLTALGVLAAYYGLQPRERAA